MRNRRVRPHSVYICIARVHCQSELRCVRLSVCLHIRLSVSWYICSSTVFCMFDCLPIVSQSLCLSICLCARTSVCLSVVRLPVCCLCVRLFVSMSVCLSGSLDKLTDDSYHRLIIYLQIFDPMIKRVIKTNIFYFLLHFWLYYIFDRDKILHDGKTRELF